MSQSSPIAIHAGPSALAHLHAHGLRAQDIGVIPAAAGGPKGLILHALDKYLFGEWLPAAPRQRSLIGASIGAWRMAAACHNDPAAAFDRMCHLYCAQRYYHHPSAQYVSQSCRDMLNGFIGGHENELTNHPQNHLHLIAVRSKRWLTAPPYAFSAHAAFGAAALANLHSRAALAKHFGRVVIGDGRDPVSWLKTKFDAFDTDFAPLFGDNLYDALLASGTLPLMMEPMADIRHAPNGVYWDGGVIDYHLELPYSRILGDTANADGALVLYPHFSEQIVPGWLDKSLPWRRAGLGKNRAWLDNVILFSPSQSFLQTLPRGKLPDRSDFAYYGEDHDFRLQNWKLAIGEGQRLRDAFAAFVERPDMRMVQAL